jgi:hypothetical protein
LLHRQPGRYRFYEAGVEVKSNLSKLRLGRPK